ncbi:MAG TPA: cytochrome c biogenesis protein CcsA [Gemmataceae bacterium]|nr:cytochrome c biogenesis protein CcsA [Gemmataceae bacterium]
MPLEGISLLCFAASYGGAFALELLQLIRPRAIQRLIGLGFGAAGLLAHTLFLLVKQPPVASQFGSTLFLAWILAVFYFYGSIHHGKVAWGVFVLPLVLGLVGLASTFSRTPGEGETSWLVDLRSFEGERIWGLIHAGLLLLAAVGVCVGFLASVMYLFQAHRLKVKTLPGHGMRLLSLERLEAMNRRAIVLAFPLLTAGLLVGIVLMVQAANPVRTWTDPRILAAAALWLVFVILLYLRYGAHLRGRRVALLTIVAFALLLITLIVPHTLTG